MEPVADGIDQAGIGIREVHSTVGATLFSGRREVLGHETVTVGCLLEPREHTSVRHGSRSGGIPVGSQQPGREAGRAIELDTGNLQGIGGGHQIAGMDAPAFALERAGHAGRTRERVGCRAGRYGQPVQGLKQERNQPRLVAEIAHTGG